MKKRHGFVSNSSSTAFIITNKTNRTLTLIDFVKENSQLLEEYQKEYNWERTPNININKMIKNAIKRKELFKPGDNYVIYGDGDGDLLGRVYDYILRDGGKSLRFRWRYVESLR